MYYRIEIDHEAENSLTSTRWVFWFDDSTLWLDGYYEFARASKRHKFLTSRCYTRTDRRNSTMTVEEAPLPDDVKAEALKKFVDQITVQKWNKS
jgi:hypothetical protein